MASGLELYEALKPTLGVEAARMIAEALPMSEQVATKADLHAMEARIFRWMLGFFSMLYLGMAGMIVTMIVKL
jgi:hypothetical protein